MGDQIFFVRINKGDHNLSLNLESHNHMKLTMDVLVSYNLHHSLSSEALVTCATHEFVLKESNCGLAYGTNYSVFKTHLPTLNIYCL